MKSLTSLDRQRLCPSRLVAALLVAASLVIPVASHAGPGILKTFEASQVACLGIDVVEASTTNSSGPGTV